MLGDTTHGQALLQLETTGKTAKKLKKHLQKYLHETIATSAEHKEALERAKENLNLAYMSAALFYMLLRVQGLDTSEHPIMEELRRIKDRFESLSRLMGQEARRSLVVDEEAAGRILAATLKELPVEERSKLKKSRKKKKHQ